MGKWLCFVQSHFFTRGENEMSKVLVIGSINMDVIISLKEVPKKGENMYCNEVSYACGGKGSNQAGATSKLGLETVYLGAVGRDTYGEILIENLKKSDIDISNVKVIGDQTGVAYVLLEEDGNNRIIVAPGANEKITVSDIDECVPDLLKEADMVMLQLEIPLDCVERIIDLAKEYGVRSFVDAGPIRGCKAERLKNAWCISPNETELGALFGRQVETEEEMIKASNELLAMGVECVLIKLGGEGCYYISKEEKIRKESYKVEAVDTTAAGDSFGAGFVYGIIEGMPVSDALDYANKCGAIAVTKKGAGDSLPTKEAVENFEKDYLLQ